MHPCQNVCPHWAHTHHSFPPITHSSGAHGAGRPASSRRPPPGCHRCRLNPIQIHRHRHLLPRALALPAPPRRVPPQHRIRRLQLRRHPLCPRRPPHPAPPPAAPLRPAAAALPVAPVPAAGVPVPASRSPTLLRPVSRAHRNRQLLRPVLILPPGTALHRRRPAAAATALPAPRPPHVALPHQKLPGRRPPVFAQQQLPGR